eukprot:TRINITY_DN2832_c0_g2_i4.p1 TRINITY_DN2832_c0_g2~~TRINITY_DN2832_c0_g2_i4.p1  ORF type:complete len:262 (+),score=31.04 TRINITY_DN2832_c0_g2_i4:532-1317(+)
MGQSRLLFAAAIGVLALISFHVGGANGFSIANICNPLLSSTGPWISGHATYYDDNGQGGACGYGSIGSQLFAGRYAAGSPRVYLAGMACGMCVEVKCVGSAACKPTTVRVTVTDLCPDSPPNTNWCGGGKLHLDLAKDAFPVIANPLVGHVPIQFRTVPCAEYKTLKLNLRGHKFWLEVTALGIPGSGKVLKMEVAGADGSWVEMKRAFGAAWAIAGKPMQTPISVRLSVFGKLCKLVAKNCISGQNFNGMQLTCGYSVTY